MAWLPLKPDPPHTTLKTPPDTPSEAAPETPLNTRLDPDRFCRLWNRCAGRGQGSARGGGNARGEGDSDGAAIFAELAAYYREPHRHYHTGGHINDCLWRMDLAEAELGRSDGVELAIWFHDVIYATGDPDNERLSADWFADKAAGVLPAALIREVENCIMYTTHREIPTDDGAKFVVDVDLSGLGMSAQSFHRDGVNIRKEFAHLSDAEYYRAEAAFLGKLLERERIYATPFFYTLCEARARRNIDETLARRAADGGSESA